MRGAVICAPGYVRVEQREDPKIIQPADAAIRLATTCVCGSDLWDWRGINPVTEPHRWDTSMSASSKRSAAR